MLSPIKSLRPIRTPAIILALASCLIATVTFLSQGTTLNAHPLFSVTPTLPPVPTPKTPHTEWLNLAYASISDAQKLDLYVPTGKDGPFPVVIYVHGGGWQQGDKREPVQRGQVDALLKGGYAVASLNYRLSGEATFPAAIQDVKTAVRWLRANADTYQLDNKHFGAWGDSAGANLVSLLGTSCEAPGLDGEGKDISNADQSSCVQAVVDFYGPTNFLLMDQEYSGLSCPPNSGKHHLPTSPESKYVGGALAQNQALVKAANPITYISKDDPPVFIEHGTADCTVPPPQSQLLYDALEPVIGQANVTITYMKGYEHGDAQFFKASNDVEVLKFLDKYLQ